MASPNTNYSEIITTTLRNRTGKLADNFSKNTALMYRLSEKGKVKPVSGGYVILQELAYQTNGSYKRYSGYETLNISPSDVFTAAEFSLKQAAIAVTMSGLEMLQNAGKEQKIDLLEARIENAEQSLIENLSSDMYSDGTSDGGRQIGGLKALVADAGTGTVGGIDSSTYTWWKNYFYSFAANSATPGATTVQAAMNATWLNTLRNRDQIDLFVADNTYFNYYWSSLQTIQRITSDKMAQAGFQNLKFMGADVIPDGGIGGGYANAAHIYGLNTSHLYWRPHRDRNMVPLDPDRFATNSDAVVKLLAFAGNMTVDNRALQGVIVA